ncbi:unnamed protein product, partial [marine sediment metagenome]
MRSSYRNMIGTIHPRVKGKILVLGHGRSMMVMHPYLHVWVKGFPSYDGEGIVYWSKGFKPPVRSNWSFMGVTAIEFLSPRIEGYSTKFSTNLTKMIKKGIDIEKRIADDLTMSAKAEGFNVGLLPKSGVHSGGTDIVVSRKPLKLLFGKPSVENVKTCECAIEVLGNRLYAKKYRFTYCKKDFNKWIDKLGENDVIPAIAWMDHAEGIRYVVLTKTVVSDVFCSHLGGQYTNYAPVPKNYSK